MLEKAYIPRRSQFGGFLHARDIRAIPTSLHRASTDALIPQESFEKKKREREIERERKGGRERERERLYR